MILLSEPPFAAATGRGVSVAVVDSGIASGHPHVGVVSRGVLLGGGGADSEDFGDRIGHGTAVAAAIVEKAPDIEILAVRVFERELATSAALLARGITWAAESGARVINLSLGTPNMAREGVLREAVDHAVTRGAIVISAADVEGVPYLPGSMAGVIGVELDWSLPRDAIGLASSSSGTARVRASGYPRPIEGVPPSRNLSGISFAVANVSGFVARLLESFPDIQCADDAIRAFAAIEQGTRTVG